MTALTTSLRCLGKPVTLTSIGLLLLNDHVLKAAVPSLLTGKLSDFAGLFFFPFLLAGLLSLALYPLRVPASYIASSSFSATVLWFSAIKIWPWANHLTTTWLGDMLNTPVLIVRDPTDLIALVVIWPAWRLWKDQAKEPSGRTAVSHLIWRSSWQPMPPLRPPALRQPMSRTL